MEGQGPGALVHEPQGPADEGDGPVDDPGHRAVGPGDEEAREEARFVLSLLNGATLQLPIVFDWEHVSAPDARTAAMTARQLNACALAFCQEIEQAGYDAMVYFNQDQARHMYDLLSLQEAGYPFWLAMYSDTMTFAHKLSMWQYTDGGNVPGISTNVDMNLLFVYLP